MGDAREEGLARWREEHCAMFLRIKKFGHDQDLANCFDLLKVGGLGIGVVMRSAYKGLRMLN